MQGVCCKTTLLPAGAEKEAADLRQKLEDRSAKLAKASQDLQALAQRAEVQTTACEHKVRQGGQVAGSLSWALEAQVSRLQAHGLDAFKLGGNLWEAAACRCWGSLWRPIPRPRGAMCTGLQTEDSLHPWRSRWRLLRAPADTTCMGLWGGHDISTS